MFKHQGIWLPDGEKHFPDWMTKNGELVDGKGTYQIRKYRAALEFMSYPRLRVAVDIGAHVGLWALQMIKNFDHVHCFEPVASFHACLKRNLPGGQPYGAHALWFLHPCALGATPGRVAMKIPSLDGGLDTGGTHVGGVGDIEMRTLDSFNLQDVDFMKLDCEGYEHRVLEGARATIARCRPTIIVEQKPHKLGPNFGIKGTPAVDLLKGMGYQVVREISGDYILTPA